MNEVQWRPLFFRESGEKSEFDILHDGIPRWLEGSIWRWLADRASEGGPSLISSLERRMHIELTKDADRPLGRPHTPPNVLLDRYWKASGPSERLNLLDAVLYDMQGRGSAAIDAGDIARAERLAVAAQSLHTILTEGASLWGVHVGAPHWGLVRRVNSTAAALVDRVATPEADAARRMAAAWNACYRHSPDYDSAYRDAVLAVEALAIPLALPNASKATLGTVIAHLRDTSARWSVGGLDAAEVASSQTLVIMLRTLWQNQERHAGPDGTVRGVARDEAEAAVSLAVTLVHWFTAGLIRRNEV